MGLRMTPEGFISRAKATHGDEYDYSISNCQISTEKVEIICRKHGSFWKMPLMHIKGQKCPKCQWIITTNKKRDSFDDFLLAARERHGDRYSYYESGYKNKSTHILINCSVHGDFRQQPCNHIRGSGCAACGEHGFKSAYTGYLYVLISECKAYMKIGITNNIEERHKRLSIQTPFGLELLCYYMGRGLEIARLERFFHKRLNSCGFSGFPGCTEWFSTDHEVIQEIQNIS